MLKGISKALIIAIVTATLASCSLTPRQRVKQITAMSMIAYDYHQTNQLMTEKPGTRTPTGTDKNTALARIVLYALAQYLIVTNSDNPDQWIDVTIGFEISEIYHNQKLLEEK